MLKPLINTLLSGGDAWIFVRSVTLLFILAAATRLLPAPDRQVAGYRPRPLHLATNAAAVLAVAGLAAGCGATPVNLHDTITAPPVGIVTNNLATFDRSCSCQPVIAVKYVQFGQPFPIRQVRQMLRLHAEPLIELEPSGIRLTSIIHGRWDKWLRKYARDVAALRSPVLMSTMPEANGNWYSWGNGRSPAAQEVTAWRHITGLFRHDADTSWIWIVNQLWPGSAPLRPLWPGSNYVNEIGIDGYFRHPDSTFTSLFAHTLDVVRGFSHRPVMITETGAKPAAGKLRALDQLVSGVRKYQLAGFIWFNLNQLSGKWALSGNSLTAFQRLAK